MRGILRGRPAIPGVIRSVRVEGARLFFPLERPEDLIVELRQFRSSAPA
jgi:hypothetical protein